MKSTCIGATDNGHNHLSNIVKNSRYLLTLGVTELQNTEYQQKSHLKLSNALDALDFILC